MESILNPTELNIYGINSFINRFEDSKEDIIDLQELKNNFDIDFKYDEDENEIIKGKLPAFTQLTFNERIIGDNNSSYSQSFNKPPIGPIENFCYCSYCTKISPEYHTENCPYPEKKSLFLTLSGIFYYIVQKPTEFTNESIQNLKQKWLNKTLTQLELNEFLLIPNSAKINEDLTNSNALTKIQYFDVVKLRGPSKLEYTTATQKFSNAIMISFEYLINEEIKRTSIRIYKNGLINLINIPNNTELKNYLYNNLIKKINNSDDNINLDNFNKIASEYTDEDYDEYTVIDEVSYIHSINCQFNLWEIKTKYSVDFNKLNNLISPYNSSGKIVSGEFTEVLDVANKQQILLKYDKFSVKLINWEHSLGKDTKTQSITREEIKCIILPIDGIKISLQIHKHGTFQMSMSYCNATDIKNGICKKVIDKLTNPLDNLYFEIVKSIFVGIFSEKSNLYGISLEYTPKDISNIKNTISGNVPPNKPGTSTAVCRAKDPRPGYPGLRPIPYSFQGQCQESRQYIDPIGVLGNDGLYYPCCSAKTKKSEEMYKKYLKEGFPKDKEQEELYGVNSEQDEKSGILIPGSTNIGALTKGLINGEWTPIKIIGTKEKSIKPKTFLAQLQDGNIVNINRGNLERDSRYFPGLKTFNKNKLIKCILKNLSYAKSDDIIEELENLADIKKLINISSRKFYNNILSAYSLNIFEEIKYYVTSVPNKSNLYYFYISPNEIYFINLSGNKIIKSLNEKIDRTIIFLGLLENNTQNFYITDILYLDKPIKEPFNKKIEILSEIQDIYFTTENTIIFPEYFSNIIKSSKDLLQESSDIFLVYTPNINYLDFKLWMPINLEPEITLQIIKKNKTNYYQLGYENTKIIGLSISLDNIFISKVFIDSNDVKINDYILFKFDFNIQTLQLAIKPLIPLEKTNKPNLNYIETLNKISLIINPIKESFFINNKIGNSFIWNIPNYDKILTFINDTLSLQNYEED
jgi:hypothetical protein